MSFCPCRGTVRSALIRSRSGACVLLRAHPATGAYRRSTEIAHIAQERPPAPANLPRQRLGPGERPAPCGENNRTCWQPAPPRTQGCRPFRNPARSLRPSCRPRGYRPLAGRGEAQSVIGPIRPARGCRQADTASPGNRLCCNRECVVPQTGSATSPTGKVRKVLANTQFVWDSDAKFWYKYGIIYQLRHLWFAANLASI